MAEYRIDKSNQISWKFIPRLYWLEKIDSNVINLWNSVLFQIDDIEYEVSKDVVACRHDNGYDEFREELIPAWDWGNIIKCWCSANGLEFMYDPNTHLYYTTTWEWFMDMMGRKGKINIMALDNTPIFDEERFTTWTEYGLWDCFVRVVKRKRNSSRSAYFV